MTRRRFPTRAEFVRACILAALASLAGCASAPPPSPFEQCMRIVSVQPVYQDDKLRAANWCVEHFE